MIEIKGLHKYYNRGMQNQVHAVNDITLSLPDKGIIALFGKSGCGKTTLLNLVGGLDHATGGEVLIEGERITPDSDKLRNAAIGYIFQNYNLSKKMTVGDNVATALRLIGVKDEKVISERVDAALKCVDMQKYKNRYPDSLSGGQQQRVAIARAIVKSPKIILADEPTGNLDEQNTVMVMDLLRAISKTCPVLLVTHESSLVDLYCDRVIEIKDGAVISDRTNESVDGYNRKKSNEVFLGDMEKSVCSDGEHTVEFYGKGIPSDLRLISSGGTVYLSVPDGVRIKIADKSSELIIHEGKQVAVAKRESADISALGAIEGTRYGRLYGFLESVVHAFKTNFIKPRIGKKSLIAGLVIFSFTVVMLVSMMGTIFTDKAEIEENYNINTVLVTSSVGKDYVEGLEERFDVKNVSAFSHQPYLDGLPNPVTHYGFNTAHFETYDSLQYFSELNTGAIKLPEGALDGARLIAGRCTELKDDEIVITKRIADNMLKKTKMSFIDSYNKLLSAICNDLKTYKVVGIVDGDDSAIFMSEKSFVKSVFKQGLSFLAIEASEDIIPEEEAPGRNEIFLSQAYINSYGMDPSYAQVGGKVTVLGKEFTVKKIIEKSDNDWLYSTFGVICYEDMKELIYPESNRTDKEAMDYYSAGVTHYAIYTSEPERVAEAIRADKGDGTDVLITPRDLYDQYAKDMDGSFRRLAVTVIILGSIMSLCLYMIMRAMLMTEIKDIGISRAIGASRKNILFRFFAEALVIFACTVFLGYLLGAFFIGYMMNAAPGSIVVFNLTPPLALVTLLGLFGISMLCGILPVFSLLKRSSAEILSKYDI